MTLDAFLAMYGCTPGAADDTSLDRLGPVDTARVPRSRTAGLFGGKSSSASAHIRNDSSGQPVFAFGRFNGQRVSEVAATPEGKRYIEEFIIPGRFPEPLKAIVKRFV